MTKRYQTAEQIALEVPGVRAWILEDNVGKTLIWKKHTPAPSGRWVLKAIIE